MTYKLDATQYHRVRPLFSAMDIHLAVDAILAGRIQGQVYVDDPARPRAALARHGQRFYLSGMPDAGLPILEHLDETLFPQACAAGQWMYVLYFAPEAWGPAIEETLAKREPLSSVRQYYATTTENAGLLPPLPEGYRLRAVDRALLQEAELEHLDALRDEICSEHPSVEAFLARDFGVCAVFEGRDPAGRTMAGWCLSEHRGGKRCEVGIETAHAHRRRGLGAAMAIALVREARARGIEHLGWHCYARNVASAATALGAGYHKVCDYPAFFGYYSEVYQLAVKGVIACEEGRTAEGLAVLRRAFARGTAPDWAYFTAASACGALGEREGALAYLAQAIDGGFIHLEVIRNEERLGFLHGTREWQALIERARELASAR
jgi:RimJ/RimL family protein N-acetyltransferase